MIKVLDYEVPNTMHELTIGQFEKISELLNNEEKMTIEKYVDVFAFLGVPMDELDLMTIPQFKECLQAFNQVDSVEFESIKDFAFGGYHYESKWTEEEEPNLFIPVKEFKLIEAYIKGHKDYMSFIMAVIFKRTDLSDAEHYANAHIKHKQKQFKELPAFYCIRYISEVMQKLSND